MDDNSLPIITPRSSNRPFVFLTLGLTLGLCFSFMLFQIRSFSQPLSPVTSTVIPAPAFTFKAHVAYLDGRAWKLVSGRWTQIQEQDELLEGDTLSTDTDSRLVLSLDDGSSVRVDSSTQLTLLQLKAAQMILAQDHGTVFARVHKQPDHRFLVQAGNISVESLGTAFAVEKDTEVKVQVYSDEVKITQLDKPETQVSEKEEWSQNSGTVKPLADSKLANSEFIDWSLKEEQLVPTATPKPTVKPKPESTPKPISVPSAPVSDFTLTGSATSTGVQLNWQVTGEVSGGFKAIKNTSGNPSYPGDSAVYLDATKRSHYWGIADGQTWHFRICQYENNQCIKYSNDISIQAPSGGGSSGSSNSGQVSALQLSASKSGDSTAQLTWTVTGTSSLGYKVVWSKNSAPTYPLRDGDQFHYLTSPDQKSDTVSGLASGNTYYFRVCEYLGGKCGTYSNEISLTW